VTEKAKGQTQSVWFAKSTANVTVKTDFSSAFVQFLSLTVILLLVYSTQTRSNIWRDVIRQWHLSTSLLFCQIMYSV